ncbi:sensor domain-containing diguanylate cyclase [uncultured Variovorax sp.]|uniref:sensor domain-containing diguanylate cyclase n=1 Tax=uncultured Variovorax sp. TaxID=114708 RepID=UPI0025FC694F|nr:sensor domain-containing diguanylate cyclase [uncultured Variovorax sp.]
MHSPEQDPGQGGAEPASAPPASAEAQAAHWPSPSPAVAGILFAHGASAVCVYDAADNVIEWNQRYLDFFPEVRGIVRVGLPFTETVRPFLQIQHPRMTPAELEENVASAVRRHRTQLGPFRYQRADTGRWLEMRAFVQPDGTRIKLWADVTEAHAAGTDSDELLRLMAVANLGLIVHDREGRLKFVNSRFFSDHFLRIITSMPPIVTRPHAAAYWSGFREIFEGDERFSELLTLNDPAGTPLPEAVTMRARTGRYYRIEEQSWEGGVASIWTDVTTLLERKAQLRVANEALAQLNAKLREAAETDSLTGLPNRRRFDATLQDMARTPASAAAEEGESPGVPVVACVGILDLDHFKSVNDRLGHDGGDAVLVEAARRLRDALPATGFIARLGGEEFGLLFRDASLDQARLMAQRLCERLAEVPFVFDGVDIHVTASIGIASFDGIAPSASLKRADHALFEAKSRGRNRVV